MATTAGASFGEMGKTLKTIIVVFLWSTSRNNWMRKLDCVLDQNWIALDNTTKFNYHRPSDSGVTGRG